MNTGTPAVKKKLRLLGKKTLAHKQQLICYSLHLILFIIRIKFTELSLLKEDLGFCELQGKSTTAAAFGSTMTSHPLKILIRQPL